MVISDHRRLEKARELEPTVAVWRTHHGDLDTLVAQASDAPSPLAFHRRSPFELETDFAKELDRPIGSSTTMPPCCRSVSVPFSSFAGEAISEPCVATSLPRPFTWGPLAIRQPANALTPQASPMHLRGHYSSPPEALETVLATFSQGAMTAQPTAFTAESAQRVDSR
jgi:hypothetical protein